MANHQTKLLMLLFLKPVHLLLVCKVFVFVVADLCTYQLYNIVDVESVLMEVQRVLVGMEFTRGGAPPARAHGAPNINRNRVTWDSLDGEFINPNSQMVYPEHPGPSRAISSVEKSMDIFMHLLTDNVLQTICHEANRYDQQNTPNDNSWKDVTPTEMIAFFRVTILRRVQ